MVEPPVFKADGPVLIFGGNYSNLEASTALLAAAARHGIAPAAMIGTGDLIAYGADPQACVSLIRAHSITSIMGNCEEQIAADAPDCACGFAPGSPCDTLSSAWFTYARTHIDVESKRWMASLPRRIDLLIGGKRLAILHGAPSQINRFLFASHPDADFLAEIRATGCDGVIAGHCGLGFTRILADNNGSAKIWHNTGAIGLPANDGTPRGWYAVLTPSANGFTITTHPLHYDHLSAARAMRRANLPTDYADTLESGIWPAFDILPLPERAGTAQPKTPETIDFPGGRTPPIQNPTAFARVPLDRLESLWFNTGTLCNIACTGCYIESSPRNDSLAYLSPHEFTRLLAEAKQTSPDLREIGFTGGEPFMNPDIITMLDSALTGDYSVLVLTNAMRPMQRPLPTLATLVSNHGHRLSVRVSLDHFTQIDHEAVRGAASWQPACAGVRALLDLGITPTIAARFDPTQNSETIMRAGFADCFAAQSWPIDAYDPAQLILFPELNTETSVEGVSAVAWAALAPRGADAMCRTARMVVQRKGAARASIVACTLLPHTPRFDLGTSLAEATQPITIDHPHCARFCVFGASSCMSAA